MQMIYGSKQPVHVGQPDQVEIEKQNVTLMMAALGSYPWRLQDIRGLANKQGCCVLAVHSGAEGTNSDLLPCLEGFTIAADVRLDNRAELRTILDTGQIGQAGCNDAGLILLAYKKWGTDCVSHLLGDYVFVLWDETIGRLFCARDIVGARPFYYHHDPDSGRFIFASDLLAMAAHPQVPMQLNLAYLVASIQMIVGRFEDTEQTYYETIEKLAPAHCLTLDPGGLKRWAYWQPGNTSERRYADEREYVEELSALLQNAVSDRVAGTHPVGAHISGGLDSSSLAVLANRILRKDGRAFTGFSWAPPLPEDPADLLSNDERKLVEAVRAAEGMSVRYTTLAPSHLLAHAHRDITLQPTTTLQFELASSEDAASLGIRTMLSGWGGDELAAFNGRGYFSDLLRRGRFLTLQHEFTQRRHLHGGSIGKQWVERGLIPLLPTALLRLVHPEDYPQPLPFPPYLKPGFAAALGGIQPLTGPDLSEHPGVRRMQIALLQSGHLSYRMESWASHGATLGITYAYPLLDQRLVEFALSIPDYLFFKNGWKRYIYRTAMQGILPDSLRWNKTKEDPAMMQGSRSASGPEVYEQLRAQLLSRKDNPYVDVEQILAAVSTNDTSSVQSQRAHLQMNPGRAGWLAFVNPRAEINQKLPVRAS